MTLVRNWACGLVGYDVALTRRRSPVRIRSGPCCFFVFVCGEFRVFQAGSGWKIKIEVRLKVFNQGLTGIFWAESGWKIRFKVWLIFFKQGLIDPEMIFKRDRDRDGIFLSKVRLICWASLMLSLSEIPIRVHVGCAREFYSILVLLSGAGSRLEIFEQSLVDL